MNIVLVGHYVPGYELAYYFDWRDAFLALAPRHAVRVIDTHVRGRRPARLFAHLPLALSFPGEALRRVYAGQDPCDLLVYAPSFYYFNQGRRRAFVEDRAASRRASFATVFFVENEYRLLADKVAYANALGSDCLVSQLPADAAIPLYGPRFSGRIVSCPAALNPSVFRPHTPTAARPIDVGTRSHQYPGGLGDDDRNRLLRRFEEGGGELAGLRIDISTDLGRRFPREQWAQFLNSCRATVATEAGAVRLLWDDGSGPEVSGKAVSSRHFEAMGTKTAQIMFGGRFNDVLEAGTHYIRLERDFGNLQEVADLVRDDGGLQRLVDRCHDLALSSHTYGHRVAALLSQL